MTNTYVPTQMPAPSYKKFVPMQTVGGMMDSMYGGGADPYSASMNAWSQADTSNLSQYSPMANSPQMSANSQINIPAAPASIGGGSWWDSIVGGINDINWLDKTENNVTTQGALMPALGVANGLFQGWMGMKQLGLANKQLKENKRQFNMNWGAQKQTINSQLEDREMRRQASRGAANPEQAVGQYMDKWGIK